MIVFLIWGKLPDRLPPCHIIVHTCKLCTGFCILYILADSVWLFAFLVVAITMDIRHYLIDLYFPIG